MFAFLTEILGIENDRMSRMYLSVACLGLAMLLVSIFVTMLIIPNLILAETDDIALEALLLGVLNSCSFIGLFWTCFFVLMAKLTNP